MKTRVRSSLAALAALVLAACGQSGPAAPDAESLKDSFARQLAANRFVSGLERKGDELVFRAPGVQSSDPQQWRVRIDSAVVDPNDTEGMPYKGTVKSSWSADGQLVEPVGSQSNLPVELLDNGLSQDCWAFWNEATSQWEWE
jgi:predicted small lipoprotein YifL